MENKEKNYAIEIFGFILVLSIIVFFLNGNYCPHKVIDDDGCSIGQGLVAIFYILPFSLLGSLGAIISAIILKRRGIIFTGLQKLFLIISVSFLVLVIGFFGFIGYENFF